MKLNTAAIFQDGMILQRGKELRIFGTAEPGAVVKAEIQGVYGETVTDSDGNWKLKLPPLTASVSEELIVKTEDEELTFRDIAVGEVWLAGGQSNMEFQMFYEKDYETFLSICENPLIRLYDVPRIASEEHRRRYDYSLYGFWRKATPEELKYVSAVGYYFARSIQANLQVPVGIINCSWGGTRSACWMDRETLLSCGKVWLDDYEKGVSEIPDLAAEEKAYFENPLMDPAQVFDNEIKNRVMKGMSKEELEQLVSGFTDGALGFAIAPWHEWRPNALYELMLKTVMPYTIRGAIYYQGESDYPHPEIYADMLEGLVKCWRKGFEDDFPILMTQLAPYNENEGKIFPELREQQELAAKRIPKVWTASTGDVGNSYDIHPKEKRPVGKRLSLLARGHVYGQEVLCDAPEGKALIREGSTLRILMENAPGGLLRTDEEPLPLVLMRGEDELPAEQYNVSVCGSELRIKLKEGASDGKYTVSFAKEPYYHVNVCNMSGIPIKPFELKEETV